MTMRRYAFRRVTSIFGLADFEKLLLFVAGWGMSR